MAFGAKGRLVTIATSVLAFGLIATGCTQSPSRANDADPGHTIVRVIDGGTVLANISGIETTVRLSNVDTPAPAAKNQPVECLGAEAAAYTKSLLAPGDVIELEYDVNRLNPAGQTLAGVYKGGKLVNAQIAAGGYGVAVSYQPNDRFYDLVNKAEQKAKKDAKGLYSKDSKCTVASRVADAVAALNALDPTIPSSASEVKKALKTVNKVIDGAKAKAVELRLLDSTGDIVSRAIWDGRKSIDEPVITAAMKRATGIAQKLSAKQASIIRAQKAAEARARAAAEARAEAKAKAEAAAEKKADEAKAKAKAEAEAEAKKKAEEAKQKAEAEAKKKAEEARKKAELAKKKAAEALKQKAEELKKEQD